MKPLLESQQLWRQIQRVPLQKLRVLCNVLLVILLAWLVALLSWQLVPTPVASNVVMPASVNAANAAGKGVDLAALLSFSLFGKADAVQIPKPEPVAVVTEAPKTQLNVKLTGLVAVSDEPNQGSAIIESKGAEATYAIDDKIDGTNAVLKQVLADRVLIQQAGRYETLMLDGIEYTKFAQANAGLGRADDAVSEESSNGDAPMPDPMEMQPLQTHEISDARRDELVAEPMKFFDYIRVSPQRVDGKLVGYRLMPGKDPGLFAQLGLQVNDLAVEINGNQLNDMQQAMAVINELRDAKEAAIKIERDGEIRDILINLSQ